MKNLTDEATTFTLQSRPFPCKSLSSYIVKNAQIDDISTTNVHNTYAIIAINELQDTGYLTVWTDIEAGDFNHSGGYCYELFSFSTCVYHAFLFLFFISDQHTFSLRLTCLLHMFDMLLPYALHVFASGLTPVFYQFKPVVRQLYSLAFH